MSINKLEPLIDEVKKLHSYDEKILTGPIAEGKWSIREIVAHLHNWDLFNANEMAPLMEDGTNLPAFPDHDSHNAAGLARLSGKSVYELVDLFVETRLLLINHLQAVNPDARFTIGTGKRKFSRDSFAKIFVRHDGEHLPQIKGMLNQTV